MSFNFLNEIFTEDVITLDWRNSFIGRLKNIGDLVEKLAELEVGIKRKYDDDCNCNNGYSRLAFICMGLGDFEYARKLFETDILLKKASWWMKIRYAENQAFLGQLLESEITIESIYAEHKDAKNGFSSLAAIYLDKCNYEESTRLYKKDRRLVRVTPICAFNYAKKLIRARGDFQDAFDIVTDVYNSDAGVRDGYTTIAELRFMPAKDYQSILRYMEIDYGLCRLSSSCKLRLAQLVFSERHYDRAFRLVDEAYKESDSLRDGYSNLIPFCDVPLSRSNRIEYMVRDLNVARSSRSQILKMVILLLELMYFEKPTWIEISKLHDWGAILKGQVLDGFDLSLEFLVYEINNNNLPAAHHIISRCWLKSDFNEGLVELFVLISLLNGRDGDAKAAFLVLGNRMLDEDQLGKALYWFNRAFLFYSTYHLRTQFETDYIAVASIRGYANRIMHKLTVISDTLPKANGGKKIKLVFLLHSIEPAAVTRAMKLFMGNSPSNVFEVFYCLSQPIDRARLQDNDICKLIESNNLKIIGDFGFTKDKDGTLRKNFIELYRLNPDVVVTAVQSPFDLFMCSAAPGAKTVNLIFGDAPGFSLADAELGIVFSSLGGCSVFGRKKRLRLNYDVGEMLTSGSVSRERLGIPTDCILLTTAGRPQKYQDEGYWKFVGEYLLQVKNVYFMVVGVSDTDPLHKKIECFISNPALMKRIKLTPRQERYLEYVALADIYVDSFPEGGGFTLGDAVKLKLPIISFDSPEENTLHYQGSPMVDMLDERTFITRGDIRAFTDRVHLILTNPDFTQELCDDNARKLFNQGESDIPPYEALLLEVNNLIGSYTDV